MKDPLSFLMHHSSFIIHHSIHGGPMSAPFTRRKFLTNAACAGALAGLGDFAFLRNLPPLSAAQVQGARNAVRLHDDIEPLVRMLEETPRNRLLEVAAERVRGGTSYQELLAAVLL